MFINPKIAIQKGWITGLTDPEKQVQPNAIDFTADQAFEVAYNDFYISERTKHMRGSTQVEPRPTFYEQQSTDSWIIPGREMLDFLSDVYVDIPDGVAAQLIIRSTLARNGLLLVSGLYDSGFKGRIGFLLHNIHTEAAVIAQGTRVGQIVFIAANSAGVYSGGYSHEEGSSLEYQA